MRNFNYYVQQMPETQEDVAEIEEQYLTKERWKGGRWRGVA